MEWPERWRAGVRYAKFRFLKRAHRRGRRSLWSLSRTGVARSVAIGSFFGILVPIAQLAFAIPVAIALRANLWVTAASTLISNPLSMPLIYYSAYRIGALLFPAEPGIADDMAATESARTHALEITLWPATLIHWTSEIAVPFMVGLLVLASMVACLGYFAVLFGWWVSDAVGRYSSGLSAGAQIAAKPKRAAGGQLKRLATGQRSIASRFTPSG